MSMSLSSAELEKLVRVSHLLLSPLDHDNVDTWRAAVNRHLGELLCADSAGFLLPVENALAMYSDEHDPKALAVFPELQPPLLPDGRSAWEEAIRRGVTTVRQAYGSAYSLFTKSTYYNEYAAVNGAHDTIAATFLLPVAGAQALASLHFWHASPTGRLFGDREMTMLRLLFPAFRAGVESQVRWNQHRFDLCNSLDTLAQAVEMFDSYGQSLHRTPALESLLSRDPEGPMIATELRTVMNAVRVAAQGAPSAGVPAFACARDVHTSAARYALRGCVYGVPPQGSGTYVLVSLERLSPARRPESELRTAFGLTASEARVAALLSEGKSNLKIATELGVSAHTARRHTERVLQKMGLHSRAQVAVWMYA